MTLSKFFACTLAACALVTVSFSTPAGGIAAPMKEVKRTPADSAAVEAAGHRSISAMAKGSNRGAGVKIRTDIAALKAAANQGAAPQGKAAKGEAAKGEGSHGAGKGPTTQYPADLGDLFGGATIPYAVQHPLYLIPNGSSCNTPACWGNVTQFLQDLNSSNIMDITDQYVNATGPRRYPVADSMSGHYVMPSQPLTDADMAAWAYATAKSLGVSGYGHIFHIFLAPEQNVCLDSTDVTCSSNAFCAYHSSAVFADIGEVVYTVEPNNVNVFGCNQPAGSPNGGFDAIYSALSQELFETITDPDLKSWFNIANSRLLGSEIGDECLFWVLDSSGSFVSSDSVVQKLNGHDYQIQTEYDNRSHGCTIHP